jgi:hypothetical protein
VGHPQAGTKLHPKTRNTKLAKVTGKTTHNHKEGILSQEPPTLTAHKPSFPTCLFHPGRIHLLCHLDSPSATNLPCLGLQEQVGPEVSGLCGSHRVLSRSPLLPPRPLSPGESCSQANNLFYQPQSPLSPRESVVPLANKTPCSPALRGHNNPLGKQTRAFQQIQQWQVTSYFPILQHKIDSRSSCRGCVTNNPRRGQRRFELFRQGMYRLSQNNHRYTPFWFRGCTRVSLQKSDQFTFWQSKGRMEEEEPFSRLTLAVYFHASGLTLVTLGTACVPPAHITLVRPPLPKPRIKHKMHMYFWSNIKILFPGLSPLGLAPRLNT